MRSGAEGTAAIERCEETCVRVRATSLATRRSSRSSNIQLQLLHNERESQSFRERVGFGVLLMLGIHGERFVGATAPGGVGGTVPHEAWLRFQPISLEHPSHAIHRGSTFGRWSATLNVS